MKIVGMNVEFGNEVGGVHKNVLKSLTEELRKMSVLSERHRVDVSHLTMKVIES